MITKITCPMLEYPSTFGDDYIDTSVFKPKIL